MENSPKLQYSTPNHKPIEENTQLKQSPSNSPDLSSPSHEFSFTITLHPSPNSSPNTFIKSNHNNNNKNKNSPSFALDLAPADDIFFHGHLLPLQFISRHPVSPRQSSDISVVDDNDLISLPPLIQQNPYNITKETITTTKTKSLSSLVRLGKWWKEKKKGFDDVGRLLKKYLSKGEKEKRDLRQRPYSFSSNTGIEKRDVGGWMRRRRGRGEFSAPASMRTSPANSGLLLATPMGVSPASDGSSMEELQSAIQAAIAHCKNSTTVVKEENSCIQCGKCVEI